MSDLSPCGRKVRRLCNLACGSGRQRGSSSTAVANTALIGEECSDGIVRSDFSFADKQSISVGGRCSVGLCCAGVAQVQERWGDPLSYLRMLKRVKLHKVRV